MTTKGISHRLADTLEKISELVFRLVEAAEDGAHSLGEIAKYLKDKGNHTGKPT